MKSWLRSFFVVALSFMLGGYTIGSVSTTFAQNNPPPLRLPLYFAGDGWASQMYVDESKGYPMLVLKFEQANMPTQFTELIPASPGTPDFMAAQFNGSVWNWKKADPVWLFEADEEVELNIQFGSFWEVPSGQEFNYDTTPSANAERPIIKTKRGYWAAVSR